MVRPLAGLVALALASAAAGTGWALAGSGEAGSAAAFPIDPVPIDRDGGPPASYARAIQRATPSVVAVYTARIVRVANRGADPREELLRRFFGLPSPRVPREAQVEERRLPAGVGSGVIVSADGYVLTNNHVISDERGDLFDEVLVRLNDGRELPAQIVGRDAKTDVAVLKVEAEGLPNATMADSDKLEVGDVVFAVGNPMGVGQTVTMGIVSATGRADLQILGEQAYENFIQTDASINPGNSGGALIDARGRLIGINTAILSRSGGNVGIGFAIPVRMARAIMLSLIETGSVQRGFLGVRIDDLTSEMAEAFGLADNQGALIQDVEKGLPADRAGLVRGDVVVAMNGRPVRTGKALRNFIGQTRPGSKITLDLIRKGKPVVLEAVLGDLNDPAGIGITEENSLFEGVAVSRLDARLTERFGVPRGVRGLVVTGVSAGSPYANALRPGTVIMEVNDVPVDTLTKARRTLRRGYNRLWVFAQGRAGYLAVRLG